MHSKKGRLSAGVAIAAAAAMLMAGCSSSGGGGEDGVTTVQFWHSTFTPTENAWYENIVEDFNESQSDIKVVLTTVPVEAWVEKMKGAQAAGKAPDIYTHAGTVEEAVAAGQLHELDGIVSDDALQEIIEPAETVSKLDGKYYAYPVLLEPQAVLFWNKDMLAAAGVDTEAGPETWEDLYAACDKILPTLAEGQYCISPAGDAVTFAWSTVGQQYNFSGHLALNEDWTAPAIDDEGYRALMDNYKHLWDAGYMPKQILAPYVTGSDYGQEKAAFKVSGSWMMSEIGSDYPELLDKTGIGPVPTAEGADGRTTTTLGNMKWVIDAKSKNAEAAGKFLEWSLGGAPENLVPYFEDTQFTKFPVRESVQEAVTASDRAGDTPWSKVIIEDIAPTAIQESFAPYPWDIKLAIGTAIESVMKGAATPDEAIKTAEDAIKLVIERDALPSKVPNK
jgi:multiple sugar transport system substrate-binding protein